MQRSRFQPIYSIAISIMLYHVSTEQKNLQTLEKSRTYDHCTPEMSTGQLFLSCPACRTDFLVLQDEQDRTKNSGSSCCPGQDRTGQDIEQDTYKIFHNFLLIEVNSEYRIQLYFNSK